MYLGISYQHKGYKCLSKSDEFYISKDVIFHEHLFCYPTLFPSDTDIPDDHSCTSESIPCPSILHSNVPLVPGPNMVGYGSISAPNKALS